MPPAQKDEIGYIPIELQDISTYNKSIVYGRSVADILLSSLSYTSGSAPSAACAMESTCLEEKEQHRCLTLFFTSLLQTLPTASAHTCHTQSPFGPEAYQRSHDGLEQFTLKARAEILGTLALNTNIKTDPQSLAQAQRHQKALDKKKAYSQNSHKYGRDPNESEDDTDEHRKQHNDDAAQDVHHIIDAQDELHAADKSKQSKAQRKKNKHAADPDALENIEVLTMEELQERADAAAEQKRLKAMQSQAEREKEEEILKFRQEQEEKIAQQQSYVKALRQQDEQNALAQLKPLAGTATMGAQKGNTKGAGGGSKKNKAGAGGMRQSLW